MNNTINMSDDVCDHLIIQEFIALVHETSNANALDFKTLQSRPFMKFWKYLSIFKYEKEFDEYRVTLFGTHHVNIHDQDHTQKLISEMGLRERYKSMREECDNILSHKVLIHRRGSMYWQKREHRKFQLARFPLQRNGNVSEVLTIVVLL